MMRGLPNQIDDADETFGFPGGAADEQTVDIDDFQDDFAVFRRHRATVNDARFFRDFRAVIFAQNFTQSAMPRCNVLGRGRLGAADGPARFVSEHDIGDARTRLSGQ